MTVASPFRSSSDWAPILVRGSLPPLSAACALGRQLERASDVARRDSDGFGQHSVGNRRCPQTGCASPCQPCRLESRGTGDFKRLRLPSCRCGSEVTCGNWMPGGAPACEKGGAVVARRPRRSRRLVGDAPPETPRPRLPPPHSPALVGGEAIEVHRPHDRNTCADTEAEVFSEP